MKANLVRIGNSKGIRIPRALIEQYQFGDVVELEPRRGQLLIRPAKKPRQGWDESFARMARLGDDGLIDHGRIGSSKWDRTEWVW